MKSLETSWELYADGKWRPLTCTSECGEFTSNHPEMVKYTGHLWSKYVLENKLFKLHDGSRINFRQNFMPVKGLYEAMLELKHRREMRSSTTGVKGNGISEAGKGKCKGKCKADEVDMGGEEAVDYVGKGKGKVDAVGLDGDEVMEEEALPSPTFDFQDSDGELDVDDNVSVDAEGDMDEGE
jgi:hypothetical protein